MPEFDGAIHGVPIANKKLLENGDVRYLPINERIVRMVNKHGNGLFCGAKRMLKKSCDHFSQLPTA